MNQFKPSDNVSILDAIKELRKRVKVESNLLGNGHIVEVNPSHCACRECVMDRVNLLPGLGERLEQLHCENAAQDNRHNRNFCERHNLFFHHMDTGCAECRKDPKTEVKDIYGTWRQASEP
jgi:hypothetical protein